MTKKGFTLAEVLMALTVLGILIGIAMPVLLKSKPDSDKIMFRKTYYTIEKTVSKMINDSVAYPDDELGFGDVSDTGQGTKNKFCYYFMNNLNVLGDVTCPENTVNSYTTNYYMGKTTDGVDWFIHIGASNEGFVTGEYYYVKILVDVNGTDKSPNCANLTTYSSNFCGTFDGVTPSPAYTCVTTCENPDFFVIGVRRDGKLKLDDPIYDASASDNSIIQPKAVEYLKDPFNNKRSD